MLFNNTQKACCMVSLLVALFLLVAAFAASPEKPASARKDGAIDKYRSQRLKMVRKHIEGAGIEDKATLEAMKKVPRHRFVPQKYISSAYDNTPLPIGHGQTISQPYIVALMTAVIQPEGGQKVLEIGTGSGYQAAVLAEIAERVYTVEIIPELAQNAASRLQKLGYNNVLVREGDGYFGWPEAAPFDAIMVTAAAPFIPPPLIDQLKEGGKMVIPVGSPFLVQTLMLVEKKTDEKIVTRSLLPVRFVPFRRAP